MIQDSETCIVWIHPDGREINIIAGQVILSDSIELRSAGVGWPWHDQEGNKWGSAGAPINNERRPRWVRK